MEKIIDISPEAFYKDRFCIFTETNEQLQDIIDYYKPQYHSINNSNRSEFPYVFGNSEDQMHGRKATWQGSLPTHVLPYEEWLYLAYQDDVEINNSEFDLDFLF